MSNNILYIEPFSGIAGDMFVSSLSELTASHDALFKGLRSLSIRDEFAATFDDTSKNGIKAKRFIVELVAGKSSDSHGRTLKEITEIINMASEISSGAKNTAIKIFKDLAKAESVVHGTTASSVHFHEVGAVDAIVDIVSAAILLDTLDVSTVISTPVSLGQGTVKSAHGTIPIPSPATLELIKGIPVNYTTIKSELTTPTGAAILARITDRWNTEQCIETQDSDSFSMKGMEIFKSGYGAGTKDIDELTNVLRVSLLKPHNKLSTIHFSSRSVGPAFVWPQKEHCAFRNMDTLEYTSNNEDITIIECNLDDYPAEHLTILGPQLLDIGALDFAIIPATMKKGRQGIILQVLASPEKSSSLTDFLLKETTTLGIRFRTEKRMVLERKFQTIQTPLGKVKIKLGLDNGKIIKAKPEQEDIAKIAQEQNKSYYQIYKEIDYYTQQWIQNEYPTSNKV